MDTNTLPRHARTGIRAVGWRKARTGEDGPQPIWPILGGAEDDGDDDGQDDGDGTGGEGDGTGDGQGPDGGDGQGDGDDALGPAGVKALAAEKARRKAEATKRRDAESRVAELEQQLAASANKDGEPDADQIRREASAEATRKANERIIRSEVRAAAAGKLADPRDALRFIDLSKFEVDDDGAVDEEEIADAIEDLLKDKAYLAAQGGRRFAGSGDGGARKGSGMPAQVTEAELDKMTPDQIEKARREGRLDDLLGVKR